MRAIDCHVHVIDPARFPFAEGPGYRPQAHETGTAEALCATLDRHGVRHALLVQPSGYGFDNAALLDAMARRPGRFRGIAVVAPGTEERELGRLAAAGVVGLRYNLVSPRPAARAEAAAGGLLARLRALDWFAQVYADDAQWPEAARILRRSGVRVLVDHFGVRDLAKGIARPGFQAVLALGRDGRSAVKLSGAFRVLPAPGQAGALAPFVEALLSTFGPERCVWGSDWPFLAMPAPPDYAECLAVLARLLPDPTARDRVLWRNPCRLFGFGGSGDGDVEP